MSSSRAISRTLFPCRLRTRISTASSATSMRPSHPEYPTPGWVSFQLATRVSFALAVTRHGPRLIKHGSYVLLGTYRSADSASSHAVRDSAQTDNNYSEACIPFSALLSKMGFDTVGQTPESSF